MEEVHGKIRAFRTQIRQRSHQEYFSRVRYQYRLQEHSHAQQQVEQLLQLVCQYPLMQLPSGSPLAQELFSRVLALLQAHRDNWQAYVGLCHQIQQLDLLTLAIEKVTDISLVLGVLENLFCNLGYRDIGDEEWRLAAGGCRAVLMAKCAPQVMQWLLRHIGQEGRCLRVLARFCQGVREAVQVKISEGLIGELTRRVADLVKGEESFSSVKEDYMRVVMFMVENLDNQLTDQTNSQLLDLIQIFLMSSPPKPTLQLLLGLAKHLSLPPSSLPIVSCLHSQCLPHPELAPAVLELVNCLCYQQSWPCYSTLGPLLLPLLDHPHSHELINPLNNLLSNQFEHGCGVGYYGVLEDMARDLLGAGVLERWVRGWAGEAGLDRLVARLVGVDHRGLKGAIVGLIARSGAVGVLGAELRRKVKLTQALLNLQADEEQDWDDFWWGPEGSEDSEGYASDQEQYFFQ